MRFTILSLGVIATLMMTSVYAGPTGSDTDMKPQMDPQSQVNPVVNEAAANSVGGTDTAAPLTKEAVLATNNVGDTASTAPVDFDAAAGEATGKSDGELIVRRAFLARRNLGHAIHKRNQSIDNTTDGDGDRKNIDEDLEDDDDEDDGNDGGNEYRGQGNTAQGNAAQGTTVQAQGTTAQGITDQGNTVRGDSAQGNMSSQFKQDEEDDDSDDDDDDDDDDDELDGSGNVFYEDYQDAYTR